MKKYSIPLDEWLNAISHYIGAVLALAGLVALIIRSTNPLRLDYLISSTVYGISLILLYLTSGTYHIMKQGETKLFLRKMDHISIYLLIASSYMPYIFTIVKGPIKWLIFSAQCALTIFGIFFKIFFTGRFKVISTLIYLLMGWSVIFIYDEIKSTLNPLSLKLLVYGGITYSLGTIFYLWKSLRFSHLIWHLFVLGGSIFHFFSIYYII